MRLVFLLASEDPPVGAVAARSQVGSGSPVAAAVMSTPPLIQL